MISKGYLEFKADGAWHLICSDNNPWDEKAASVACRQLGYENGAAFTQLGQVIGESKDFLNLDSKDLPLRIGCNGEELDLANCSLSQGNRCDRSSHSVFVKCNRPSLTLCPKEYTPFQKKCYKVKIRKNNLFANLTKVNVYFRQ